jgi:hypothetical protein
VGCKLALSQNRRSKYGSIPWCYIDKEEAICSSAMRTASLISFLDTTGIGLALPPTSVPVTPEFAKDIDGYMRMEIWRNHFGMEDIHKELRAAIASTTAALAAADAEAKS